MYLRWIMLLLLTIGLISASDLISAPLDISIKAESAILINAESGAVIYEKNAHQLRYPASITKIATAAYALKMARNKLDSMVTASSEAIATISNEARSRSNYTVPAYWLGPDSSHIGIKRGEELSLRNLILGALIVSGSDATNVIAEHISGTIPEFMNQLNLYLRNIGCLNTKFYNPSGVHHPEHKSTAYDLAIMFREALKDPILRESLLMTRFTRPKTNKQEATVMLQTNALMRKGKHHYSKAIGGKTGYHSHAKHCLAAAAKVEDRTLIAVLLGCETREERFSETIRLFEAAFSQAKVQKTFLRKGAQTFTRELKGAAKPLSTYTKEDLAIAYYPSEEPEVKCLLTWLPAQLPIGKDQPVGELQLIASNGNILRQIPLFAKEEVLKTASWW